MFFDGANVYVSARLWETHREQIRFGLTLLAGFVGTGVVLGWIMRAFPL